MGLRSTIKRFIPKVSFGEETSIVRSSKGVTRDGWYAETYRGTGNAPADKLNFMLEIFQQDPVVNTAITTRVNAVLASGWSIEGTKKAVKETEETLKKTGFNYSFLRQLFLNAVLYRHVFIEIEKNRSGTPIKLHVLETPEMEIKHDKHGEVEAYLQRAVTGEVIIWKPEDVVYIAFDKVSTSLWGNNGLRSLYDTVITKSHIEEFLKSLALTKAWRDMTVFQRMSKEDQGAFAVALREAQKDPTKPFIISTPTDGGVEIIKLRDPGDLKEFQQTLEYLRSQILMVFKVPPIMVGLPDSSNRSNSDTQFMSFNIANNADRLLVQDAINKELFDKLGLSDKAQFLWNPIDKRDDKVDVEMAEKLMNMGAKPDKVEEFLRMHGLDLPDDFFPDEPVMTDMKAPDDAASRPSRQRKGDGPNDKIGTGSNSTTREEQLR